MGKMYITKIIILFNLLILLTSCAQPVPPESTRSCITIEYESPTLDLPTIMFFDVDIIESDESEYAGEIVVFDFIGSTWTGLKSECIRKHGQPGLYRIWFTNYATIRSFDAITMEGDGYYQFVLPEEEESESKI